MESEQETKEDEGQSRDDAFVRQLVVVEMDLVEM